jgi:hypothetical protein
VISHTRSKQKRLRTLSDRQFSDQLPHARKLGVVGLPNVRPSPLMIRAFFGDNARASQSFCGKGFRFAACLRRFPRLRAGGHSAHLLSQQPFQEADFCGVIICFALAIASP